MAYSPASSNTYVAPANGSFLSLYDAEIQPEVMRELFQKTGKGLEVLDFLRMAGREIFIANDTVTTFEEGAWNRPVKTESQISTGDATTISFEIHEDQYEDTYSWTTLREGDTVYIPAYYFSGAVTEPKAFVVTSVAAENSNCSARAMESGLTIGTAVPSGTYLHVGPSEWGRATDQPDARTRGFYSNSFYTAITKATADIDGGVQSHDLYFVPNRLAPGTQGIWGMMYADAEFDLDEQISTKIMIGQTNGNSVTQTNARSSSVSVLGSQGIWGKMGDDGSDLPYIDSFSVSDIDSVHDLLIANGQLAKSAVIGAGDKLYGQMQVAAHDYIAQYSGGTDLKDAMGKVGFTCTEFERSGTIYKLVNLAQLSNQNTFGADAQDFWQYAGFVLPDEQVTVRDNSNSIYNAEGRNDGGKITIPNLAIGYLASNGENRKRIIKHVAGMNGFDLPASNTYDRVQLGLLSEHATIMNEASKTVRLMKEGTY